MAFRLERKRHRAVVGVPEVDVGLHLEVKVRYGRVTRVSEQTQRIAFPDEIAFADLDRSLPEVGKDDEQPDEPEGQQACDAQ